MLPSTTCGCLVFVSNLVPETEIKMAPIGAVKTILSTQIINIISAYLWSSGLELLSSDKRFKATGPRAACTVAFAIQDKATKIWKRKTVSRSVFCAIGKTILTKIICILINVIISLQFTHL